MPTLYSPLLARSSVAVIETLALVVVVVGSSREAVVVVVCSGSTLVLPLNWLAALEGPRRA